jgi:hypothetical protein
MARYTQEKKWSRWSGRVAELSKATRLALEEIAKFDGSNHSGQQGCHITIALPGLTMSVPSPEEMEEQIGPGDLGKVTTIRIEAAGVDDIEVARIVLERKAPALTLEVKSNDRTHVEGLVGRLTDLLERGAGRFGWYKREHAGAIGLLFGFAVLVATLELGQVSADSEQGAGPAVLLGLVGGGALAAGLWWLIPDLELLDETGITRFRRFRGAIWSVLGAIIVGIGGSFLYAWLSR